MLRILITTFSFCVIGLGQVYAAGIVGRVSSVGDTLHFEFQGQNQWVYEVNKNETKGLTAISIQVPRLNEGSLVQLKNYKVPPVKEIKVDRSGPDGTDVVTVMVASTGLDLFDYLTDQPSRLIVDIFPGKAEPLVPQSSATAAAPTKKKIAKTKNLSGKSRAPASEVLVVTQDPSAIKAMMSNEKEPQSLQSGIFDGGDPEFSRFSIKDYEIKESSIISSKENVYVAFPMLVTELPTFAQLNAKQPLYDISPKDNDENKQARLLLTLYKNKRYNVFLKTVDWFVAKYAKSEYDEIIRFMWADALYNLWIENHDPKDHELAMLRYKQALEAYPNSDLAERTSLLLGFATLEKGDYIGAIRLLQNHVNSRPASPNKDVAKLAQAEALLKINKFDDAVQMYDAIEKSADQPRYRVQAAYLKGDVYYQKKDYAEAIEEYQSALKKYPQESSDYPNAYYNQASSYFGSEKYRESLTTYVDFLKKFPSHPYAGFAMTRAGELLDVLGADKTRVMGAYLETYFRYGDTPGSVVARLRMLSSRMKGMKPKEIEHAVTDIMSLAEKSDLPKIDQFATLMVAEGYSNRAEFDKSINLLVKYYQSHPTTADTELLTNRIVRNINDKLRKQVDSGQFIEALKTHNQFSDTWLKSTNRFDTKYNVGRAFEQAGVFAESEKLYRSVLNGVMGLKGTKSEKERNIFEQLPSTDELNLRLAAVTTSEGKFSQAYDYLKQIEKPSALDDKQQIERVYLAAQLLDKKGDPETAVRYLLELIKTWKGLPEMVADSYLFLGQLENKIAKSDDAIKSFERVDELMTDSEKVHPATHAKAIESLGNIYFDKGDKAKALGYYEKLLSKYESTKPLASIRYKVGKIYFEKGEIQKASDVWKELKSEQNDKSGFWYKLAQEQLKNSEWQSDYKKYIRRIPAMERQTK